jgi:hypothetical protein
MIWSKIVAPAAIVGAASARKVARAFGEPTENGFPNPNDQQVLAIAQQAGGKLPNAPPATSVGDGTATAFQLIAFNELFEVSYFTSLINNITSNAPGYQAPAGALNTLIAVQAQEEFHALGAISTLKAAGRFAPSPCEYQFPVDNFNDAIALAETFTAVVLGALQDANVLFSLDGAQGPVRLVSSVIGQEGEQNGYYRILLDRIAPESPFLTTVPGAFAFSALQLFVVPGSCPFALSEINLPIFPTINTNGGPIATISANDQVLSFSVDLSGSQAASKFVGGDGSGLWLTYTTGQQLPFSVPIRNVKWSGETISFEANFPYEEFVMHGFSHGALTTSDSFSSADAVVGSTLAAPAVIQVNNPL